MTNTNRVDLSPSVSSRLSRFLSSTLNRNDSAVLLLSDGSVQLFPISSRVFGSSPTVADVIRLNPGHDVNSLTSSRKRLPPEKKLRGGSTYYLLPREDCIACSPCKEDAAPANTSALPRSQSVAEKTNKGTHQPTLSRNKSARIESTPCITNPAPQHGSPPTIPQIPKMPKPPLVIKLPDGNSFFDAPSTPLAPLSTSRLRRPLNISIPATDQSHPDTCPSPRRAKTPGPYIGQSHSKFNLAKPREDAGGKRLRSCLKHVPADSTHLARSSLPHFVSPRVPYRQANFGNSKQPLRLAIPEEMPNLDRTLSPTSSWTPGAYLSEDSRRCSFGLFPSEAENAEYAHPAHLGGPQHVAPPSPWFRDGSLHRDRAVDVKNRREVRKSWVPKAEGMTSEGEEEDKETGVTRVFRSMSDSSDSL